MGEIPKAQDQLFDRRLSAGQKYAAHVVGRPGLWPLVRHEVITLLAQSTPGALGLALRKVLYPRLLGACGRNVVFGQNVVLRHPGKIRIGNDVVIDDNCLLDAKGESNTGITIGNGVFVGRNSILSCKNGDIELGDRVNIGFNCEVFSASRVVIEADTLLAAYCYVVGGGHEHGDASKPIAAQARHSRGITIGEAAWLGAGATVFDGVRIGAHAIAGAQAVVRVDLPPYAVMVGGRSRIIGTRDGAPPPAEE